MAQTVAVSILNAPHGNPRPVATRQVAEVRVAFTGGDTYDGAIALSGKFKDWMNRAACVAVIGAVHGAAIPAGFTTRWVESTQSLEVYDPATGAEIANGTVLTTLVLDLRIESYDLSV